MFSERGMFAIFLKIYHVSKTADFFLIFLVMIIITKREP